METGGVETVRFAIYSRKSVLTDRGESVENQVELCRRCLAAQYPDVRPGDIAVYEDEGFSGKDLQRPQFRRMLEDIRRERPEALVCYRLDRVSRSVGDFADLIRRLEGWGVGFLCIREKFDTSSPMGKAMMYIASVFAQLERETIAQRVRDNMRLLARTGRWLGGVPPTGFRAERAAEVIVDGRLRTACRLVPEPAEWLAAGEIFRLFLARQSLTGLPAALADMGVTNRQGKPFSPAGLREILQNPVYCAADGDAWAWFAERGADLCFGRSDCDPRRGLLAYQKRDYSGGRSPRNPVEKWIVALGRHPALVPGRTWIAAQALLNPGRAPAVHNPKALLSGLLFCGRCGVPMLPKARRGGAYDYICRTKLRGGVAACPCQNLAGAETDHLVLSQVLEHLPGKYAALAGAALDRAEQRALCRAMLQGCRWDGEALTLTLCRL